MAQHDQSKYGGSRCIRRYWCVLECVIGEFSTDYQKGRMGNRDAIFLHIVDCDFSREFNAANGVGNTSAVKQTQNWKIHERWNACRDRCNYQGHQCDTEFVSPGTVNTVWNDQDLKWRPIRYRGAR